MGLAGINSKYGSNCLLEWIAGAMLGRILSTNNTHIEATDGSTPFLAARHGAERPVRYCSRMTKVDQIFIDRLYIDPFHCGKPLSAN